MPQIIQTANLNQINDSSIYDQVYNGLDSCLTLEIFNTLQDKADNPIYAFERALQAPILEIMLRGVRVDRREALKGVIELSSKINRIDSILQQYVAAIWDKIDPKTKQPINANSPEQIKNLLYNHMHFPEQYKNDKGVRKLSVDRDALEKLQDFLYARPIVNCLLAIRDLKKQKQIFETEIDNDDRWRTSYNIAGTETGRLSSSASSENTGSNFQNIDANLRHIFLADPGYYLIGIDLEQAESREVGWLQGILFDRWEYLDACYCLTEDHEVLTPNGWIKISEKPEVIMTVNGNTTHSRQVPNFNPTEAKFTKVMHWNEFETKSIINFNGRNFSHACTINHKMGNGREAAIVMNLADCSIPISTEFNGENNISIDEARFLAAYQADGHTDETGKTHFSFTKERKIKRMTQLLDRLKYKYSIYNLGSGATRFYLSMINGLNLQKFPGAYMLNWNQRAISAFIEELEFWDGHKQSGDDFFRVTSKHKSTCEWYATLAHLCGYSATINPHKDNYWSLSIIPRAHTKTRYVEKYQRFGKYKVYCPTTISGYFFTRHNGLISITGNSGDLHTLVCKLTWKNLPWTGDPKKDREIAEQPFYRDFEYRFMAKKLGHGSNYYGKPPTLAKHAKIPIELAEQFQHNYFSAFPGFPLWHNWVAEQLKTSATLTTPWGRTRQFFDRSHEDSTLRKAIAFSPQSSTADRTNLALWRIWHHVPQVQLLAQIHDAIYAQCPVTIHPNDIIPILLKQIDIRLHYKDRELIVPGEAKIGYNLGSYTDENDIARWQKNGAKGNPPRLNLLGLKKFKENAPDERIIQHVSKRLN